MNRIPPPLPLLASSLLVFQTELLADDWPQWRGPNRNGISAEKGWLQSWPKEPPVAWKAKVGLGFASFAVSAGKAFTSGHADENDTIFCFESATGKLLWKYSYPAELGDKYFDGGTTGTPSVDGDRVYTLSRWGDVFCFEAASGKVLWKRNVQAEAGMPVPDWGYAGSPTIFEKLVLLNVGDAGMALDKLTGQTVWQSAKKSSGYSTPLPFQQQGKWLALIGSGQSYVAVDPLTGQEAWRMRWLTEFGVNAADPIIDGDTVFISTGYGKGAALLKPRDGKEPEVLWRGKVLRTQLNPAVLIAGFLYGIDGDTAEKANLKCVDIKTGAEKWSQSGIGSGGVTSADGKLIVLTERGELIVAPATPDGFKPSARAQVLGGKSWTAPVLANGRLYCRNSRGDVVCVDLRGN